jgi:hypothetical protein
VAFVYSKIYVQAWEQGCDRNQKLYSTKDLCWSHEWAISPTFMDDLGLQYTYHFWRSDKWHFQKGILNFEK